MGCFPSVIIINQKSQHDKPGVLLFAPYLLRGQSPAFMGKLIKQTGTLFFPKVVLAKCGFILLSVIKYL